MTTSILKTLSTKLVVAAILFSFILSPMSARAQTPDISAQLNSLVAALSSIGASIQNVSTLSEEERYTLIMQLIGISTQILALRGTNAASQVDPLETEAAKDSAREAGLTRVLVDFDPATNQAVTDVTINSRVTRTTYTLPELASSAFFTDKIQRLREILAMRISDAENVKYREVYDLLFVTALDPERLNPIAVNSTVATYLANNFAKHSILTKVQILPGDGTGTIKIFTDQDDFVELTLTREADSEGTISSTGDFFYTREYFIDDRINPGETFSSSADDFVPQPRAFDSERNIPEAEVEIFLTMLLNDIPFTSQISNFGQKLTRFLVDNPITINESASTPDDRRDCYVSADKAVVDEFIEYVVEGLEAQYEDIPSITEYVAPLGGDGSGCSARTRFF